MAKRQYKGQFDSSQVFPLEDCGTLASISKTTIDCPISLQRQGSTGNRLLITGLPILKTGDLNRYLDSIVEQDYQAAAKELTQLDGAFAALYWDCAARKLAIVTDFLGMQPLYLARCGGSLLLASEIQAIAASGFIEVEMDPAAWGAFVTFGHFIANRTSLKPVERVAPGSILIYDPDSDRLTETPYWKWPSPQREMSVKDLDTGFLVDTFAQDIRRSGTIDKDRCRLKILDLTGCDLEPNDQCSVP